MGILICLLHVRKYILKHLQARYNILSIAQLKPVSQSYWMVMVESKKSNSCCCIYIKPYSCTDDFPPGETCFSNKGKDTTLWLLRVHACPVQMNVSAKSQSEKIH